MIKGAVATVILILVLTGWMQRRHGEAPTKAKYVIPLWGLGGAFVVAAVTVVWWYSATRDFDACTARVERSGGNRTQTEQLMDTIDEATGTDHFTSDPIIPGKPSLRESLDENLPVLSGADCEDLKP